MRLLNDEPGAQEVAEVLEGDDAVALPFMVLMEIRYVLLRGLPQDRVDQVLTTLRASGADILESDPSWGALAAEVKSRGGLSLADAWIAALALRRQAVLIHRDPEFEPVPALQQQWLGPARAGR
jgi:predicted nucleic acid-binding protein